MLTVCFFFLFSEGENDKNLSEFNPWPFYRYTGKLRPAPRDPVRKVPEAILRPDYATHPTGIPVSEQAARSAAYIKVLDDEEIDGMRIACKVIFDLHKFRKISQN